MSSKIRYSKLLNSDKIDETILEFKSKFDENPHYESYIYII